MFQKSLNRLKQRKARQLLKSALQIEATAVSFVARKTGRLESSIATGNVEDRGQVLSIDIGTLNNPPGYEFFVERGVKGRTYNYRRDGEIVYSGVGQQFLKRSLDVNKRQFFQDMKNA